MAFDIDMIRDFTDQSLPKWRRHAKLWTDHLLYLKKFCTVTCMETLPWQILREVKTMSFCSRQGSHAGCHSTKWPCFNL